MLTWMSSQLQVEMLIVIAMLIQIFYVGHSILMNILEINLIILVSSVRILFSKIKISHFRIRINLNRKKWAKIILDKIKY